MLQGVTRKYFVTAERESGLGRADLLLIPKPTAKYQNALVLEFKFGKLETDLHLLAQKALEQIELKNYAAQIKAYKNVASTFKVGIAFGGKDVEVAFRE